MGRMREWRAPAALRMGGVVLAAVVCAGPVRADPGQAIAMTAKAIADAPPETQERALRIVFRSMFGSRAELKAQFVSACAERDKAPAPAQTERPLADVAQEKAGQLSRAAVLAALCNGPARAQVEAALTPPPPGARPAASVNDRRTLP